MGNQNIISNEGIVAYFGNYTIHNAENGIVARGKVNTLVELKLTRYGMNAPAKPRSLLEVFQWESNL